jgi:hypothetical protein
MGPPLAAEMGMVVVAGFTSGDPATFSLFAVFTGLEVSRLRRLARFCGFLGIRRFD